MYKNKDVNGYVKAMETYFGKMENNLRSADYGKAAQNLYMAAGKSLKAKDHEVAIRWAEESFVTGRCCDGSCQLYGNDR